MQKRFRPKRMSLLPEQVLDAKGNPTGEFGAERPTAVVVPKEAK
jgi:hypothetical protein